MVKEFFFSLNERWSWISFGLSMAYMIREANEAQNRKKTPEESGCSGNYWLLKCIERWISSFFRIIRQVLLGNRSESRQCGLCIMTLSNEADWSCCQESDWPWTCFVFSFFFLFYVPTRQEMDVMLEDVDVKHLKQFGQILYSVWHPGSEGQRQI